jgi:hypothetical protein
VRERLNRTVSKVGEGCNQPTASELIQGNAPQRNSQGPAELSLRGALQVCGQERTGKGRKGHGVGSYSVAGMVRRYMPVRPPQPWKRGPGDVPSQFGGVHRHARGDWRDRQAPGYRFGPGCTASVDCLGV